MCIGASAAAVALFPFALSLGPGRVGPPGQWANVAESGLHVCVWIGPVSAVLATILGLVRWRVLSKAGREDAGSRCGPMVIGGLILIAVCVAVMARYMLLAVIFAFWPKCC